jgi:hypothetical protein
MAHAHWSTTNMKRDITLTYSDAAANEIRYDEIMRCVIAVDLVACIVVVILCVLLYCVCIAVFPCTLDAGLLARSQYMEGPATGHLDTGFSWFPCVYK